MCCPRGKRRNYIMNVPIILLMFGYLSLSSSLPTNEVLKSSLADSIQAKRDLSLSYAATDIGSKEGTRVKTITVIKNVAGKKDKLLKVDPKLHETENWGSQFRDNFNTYGVIPDVPDIDDLFEFVNKKIDKNPKEKTDEQNKKSEDEADSKRENEETTVSSTSAEETSEPSKENVEKILGDAELIQPRGKQGKVKSQSLDLGKYSVQDMFNVNYSTPQHSVRQYFSNSALSGKKNDKYIQSPSDPYYYPQPGRPSSPNAFPSGNDYSPQLQSGRGSVSVTTPSGRKFDVPFGNETDASPYIAPNFRKIQSSPPGQQIVTSSQRPYIAPNLRKSYEVQLNQTLVISNSNCFPNTTNNRQQPAISVYRNVPTNIRTDGVSGYRPNIPRSRGLRY